MSFCEYFTLGTLNENERGREKKINKVRASVMHGMSSASSQGSPVLDNSSMKSKMADTVLNGVELRLQSESDIVVGFAGEMSRVCATGQQ